MMERVQLYHQMPGEFQGTLGLYAEANLQHFLPAPLTVQHLYTVDEICRLQDDMV